jgi:purine-binding chemotaxis protein CheW
MGTHNPRECAKQETIMSKDKAKADLSGLDGEYLVFRIGNEEYGFEILSVQEIRSYEQPTKMVNSPDFVKGVIDLRQNIIPIVDLRMKMGYSGMDITPVTVVIVVNVNGTVLGMVVDSVADVVDIKVGELHAAPPTSVDENGVVKAIASIKREALEGGERMVSLLDLPRLAGDLVSLTVNAGELLAA